MSNAGKFAWSFVLVVAILHFDFWAWDDDTLVVGYVPMALAFHAALSIAAAIGWALVVVFDWPENVEAWANQADDEGDDAPDASQAGGRP